MIGAACPIKKKVTKWETSSHQIASGTNISVSNSRKELIPLRLGPTPSQMRGVVRTLGCSDSLSKSVKLCEKSPPSVKTTCPK